MKFYVAKHAEIGAPIREEEGDLVEVDGKHYASTKTLFLRLGDGVFPTLREAQVYAARAYESRRTSREGHLTTMQEAVKLMGEWRKT